MTANLLGMLVLVLGVPLNAVVVYMLWRRSSAFPRIRVLNERAVTASLLLLAVFVFGLIFVNNDTVPPPLPAEVTKWVTRSVFLLLAVVPAVYWLVLYLIATNDERDERDVVRDDARDLLRDEGRDTGRDEVRDPARDIARDAEHDATDEP